MSASQTENQAQSSLTCQQKWFTSAQQYMDYNTVYVLAIQKNPKINSLCD